MPIQAIGWGPGGAVRIVDQRALPERVVTQDLETAEAVGEALRTLAVRGAPLIGIAAAMGLVADLRHCRAMPRERFLARLAERTALLSATRPTAVNLRWALDRMTRVAAQTPGAAPEVWARLRDEAEVIWAEDREMCARIGAHGLALIPDRARVLTHCNAGALATGGAGTALAPVYAAHAAGRQLEVLVDETRPLLQGARLTAWELGEAGIACVVIVDSAAAALMRAGRVDVVLVGADRIAANGDVANKIGTYGLAVAARHHGVPFFVAAPRSSIDLTLPTGEEIPIEERAPEELTTLAGHGLAPPGAVAYNPAFDVTPAALVSGYITDRGVTHPPFTI